MNKEDMTQQQQIELNDTIERYDEILKALRNISHGIHSSGNTKLGIRSCLACENNHTISGCSECFMSIVFGGCINLGWSDLNNTIGTAIINMEDMLEKLRDI